MFTRIAGVKKYVSEWHDQKKEERVSYLLGIHSHHQIVFTLSSSFPATFLGPKTNNLMMIIKTRKKMNLEIHNVHNTVQGSMSYFQIIIFTVK